MLSGHGVAQERAGGLRRERETRGTVPRASDEDVGEDAPRSATRSASCGEPVGVSAQTREEIGPKARLPRGARERIEGAVRRGDDPTSTFTARGVAPTGITSCSWSARKSAACGVGGRSPISSRKSVPPPPNERSQPRLAPRRRRPPLRARRGGFHERNWEGPAVDGDERAAPLGLAGASRARSSLPEPVGPRRRTGTEPLRAIRASATWLSLELGEKRLHPEGLRARRRFHVAHERAIRRRRPPDGEVDTPRLRARRRRARHGSSPARRSRTFRCATRHPPRSTRRRSRGGRRGWSRSSAPGPARRANARPRFGSRPATEELGRG